MKCYFYVWTGLYCPGCGITRAILSLLRGDFYQAFRYNPFVIGTVPVIVIAWVALFKQHRLLLTKIMQSYMYLCFAFGILRNLPCTSFLAPTCVR